MKIHRIATVVASMLLVSCGCSSIKSTHVLRVDKHSFVGNSNGDTGSKGEARGFDGVPITLQVPSHLDVYVVETYYIHDDDGKDGPHVPREVEPSGRRNLNIQTKLIKTKKVFTVDFLRPGAGSLNYGAEFNANQYFSTLSSTIDDQTIAETSAAIQRIVPAFAKLTSAADTNNVGTTLQDKVIRAERTVAYQRFDINAPDFEFQLECFVSSHLNNCNACDSDKKAPGVKFPKEVSVNEKATRPATITVRESSKLQ